MPKEGNGIEIGRLKELIRARAKAGEGMSLEDRRKQMDGNANQFPVPEGVEIARADLEGFGGEWNIPAGAETAPVLLYFHGGGYVQGSSVSHRHLTSRLALAAKARVLSVDYALAPEAPFPAAVRDGVKAYRWLLDNGVEPKAIALGGDSAGGGLTVATLLAARDEGLPMPAAAIAISPWTDLTCDTGAYSSRADADPMIQQAGIKQTAALYLNGADARHPLASPNHADLTGLPPMLIHVGSDEVLFDDAANLCRKARDAGIDAELEEWEDMIHVWHAFYQLLPQGEEAIERLGNYLSARWKSRKT
ncbi:alpha/beta hydrolase [Parvibaculum sp.]|uniref:alpha/beta hydrolase n=1 Tax=Parvibaculum sp. TaxID=2024848 RepID=UPI001B1CC02F|nr:alpha/beta hydrolase [Parvibaculum sp.]MBO6667126.1 alpha/beta hydrolase [Parvibaculum sp.]MBO6692266.1 alpha/beta hydrolase [Parvibaculum sp.]MBO6713679.1 alpha/beta hydrolase [Parvibaculum sp.]